MHEKISKFVTPICIALGLILVLVAFRSASASELRFENYNAQAHIQVQDEMYSYEQAAEQWSAFARAYKASDKKTVQCKKRIGDSDFVSGCSSSAILQETLILLALEEPNQITHALAAFTSRSATKDVMPRPPRFKL